MWVHLCICCAWWRREYRRPAHTSRCNTTQWQVTLHVHTLEQRFFNYSVTAPRVQIYSNILNLWDTSLNFSVHTGRISLHSRRRFFRAKGEISNTRARTREEKEGRPPLPFACFPRAFQQLTKKLTGVCHAGYGRIVSATFVTASCCSDLSPSVYRFW